MWVFLTRRLRMWVLLAIAVPLARVVVHRLAVAANKRSPDASTTRWLQNADSAVTSASQHAKQARRR
jgi:hypothetical protein